MSKRKRKPRNNWSNYGDKTQVYDVVFEVDKLDFLGVKNGKDSSEYTTQKSVALKLINTYNTEHGLKRKEDFPLSLSKCRSILQGERHNDSVVFYNSGKTVSSNKQEMKDG